MTSSTYTRLGLAVIAVITTVAITGCSKAGPDIEAVTTDVLITDEPGRTCIDRNPLRNPYFGDTHVHTTYSVDAYSQNVRSTPNDAYAFAKGEEIGLPPYDRDGTPLRTAQLERPLDFTMISDHSEFFGDVALCLNPVSNAYNKLSCKIYRGQGIAAFGVFNYNLSTSQSSPQRQPHCGVDGENCINHSITLWQETQLAAEAAYDRSDECSFTSFVGYEWTGSPKQSGNGLGIVSQNLHRNVLFANAQVPERPSGYFRAPYPEDLWDTLSDECLNATTDSGEACDVLTIPHNSNLSAGLMFEQLDKNGEPIGAEYSEQRAAFEPIVELVQHKGSSECQYTPGGNDEECAFEYLPWGHLVGNLTEKFGEKLLPWVNPTDNSFVRDALKEGLKLKQELNVNPFKYGFIGSTDTHLGTPGLTNENNYPGHGGAAGAGDTAGDTNTTLADNPEHNPGGLAVVWAEQNTRSSIFDAMKRKEVYATSGPRHTLRFFGGWDYDEGLCDSADLVQSGYEGGVPMGGDLFNNDVSTNANSEDAPKFVVSVLKDTMGADLQYVQIIKGWVDSEGNRHEAIYDVAGNKNNGASVDLDTCEPVGVGASNLCNVWQDPDFSNEEEAFYYARVIENPTCRWNQHQCLNSGGKAGCDLEDQLGQPVAKTVKERSWSSPIWYSAQP